MNEAKLKADKARWYQENKALCNRRNAEWVKANPEKRSAIAKKYYEMNAAKHRIAVARAQAKRRNIPFTVAVEEVQEAERRQAGLCAICGNPEIRYSGRLSIDHCHQTGRFRGLLCNECNLMLGKAKDESGRLRLAAQYLEQRVGLDFDGHA